jgi:O-phosphoseryl-tRNA(Cys) synthetase
MMNRYAIWASIVDEKVRLVRRLKTVWADDGIDKVNQAYRQYDAGQVDHDVVSYKRSHQAISAARVPNKIKPTTR